MAASTALPESSQDESALSRSRSFTASSVTLTSSTRLRAPWTMLPTHCPTRLTRLAVVAATWATKSAPLSQA